MSPWARSDIAFFSSTCAFCSAPSSVAGACCLIEASVKPEPINAGPLEDRVEALKPDDLTRALEEFRAVMTRDHAAALASCVHCGLCSETCHYYLATRRLDAIPAYKLGLVASVFRRHEGLLGKVAPGWVGARTLNHETIKAWIDALFGRCSLCGRCALNCTMGINITAAIRAARGVLAALDLVPPGLKSTVDTALIKGNNMGISENDFVETLAWLEGEMQSDAGFETARMYVEETGCRMLYTLNPREVMFFPLSIVAVAKIFHAAGESWTFSKDGFDVTNYGLYDGSDAHAGTMSGRLVTSMERLGAGTLVLAECGHGFNSNRWEAPQWLNRRYPFEVKSILQVVAGYLRDGRIKVDAAQNTQPVTLHDPCNLVRLGGIVEEQRYLLRHTARDFREMTPNREHNYCCGGGGGQLAMTNYADRRLEAGRIKADQIRRTGAKIVAVPCHNCIDQLMELNKHYGLGVELKTVCELVANALVVEP
ncbi:(Fe-S)-binding protein [Candidatus Fermentibacteria bacterium]|nr:(Fe-S)-binding protein [Candidatus Fermentibacteria bacterium]